MQTYNVVMIYKSCVDGEKQQYVIADKTFVDGVQVYQWDLSGRVNTRKGVVFKGESKRECRRWIRSNVSLPFSSIN